MVVASEMSRLERRDEVSLISSVETFLFRAGRFESAMLDMISGYIPSYILLGELRSALDLCNQS